MAAGQILVIDEGTTSTRAMLFGADGKLHGSQQEELTQYYPEPGLVEHDAGRDLGQDAELLSKDGGTGWWG